jgi:phosphoenolpyruvate carboxykinase (ATP)
MSEDIIWWDANARMTPDAFDRLHADMRAPMVGKDYFVQDLFAGADQRYCLAPNFSATNFGFL